MKLMEKTKKQEYRYKGKILNLRVDEAELENGRIAKREVVEHPGGVTIAALTEQDELLFVRQFRYPYGEVVLELPAGKLEAGEDPFEAGKRELLEETGAEGRDYVFLGNLYPSPGYCGEIIRIYACRISSVGDNNPDDDEFIEVERIPIDKAVSMVMENEIPDAKTQVGILKTAMLLKEYKI